MKVPSHIPARVLVIAGGILVLAALLACVPWVLHKGDRSDALAQSTEMATRLSAGVASRVAATLRTVDFTLQSVRQEYLEFPERLGATASVSIRVFAAESGFRLMLADERGSLVYASREPERAQELLRLVDMASMRDGGDRLFIGRPVRDAASGEWMVFFARPVLRDGRFAGVVAVGLSPQYLSQILHEIELAEINNVALFDLDGHFLARNNRLDEVLGKRVTAGRPFVGADPPVHGHFVAAATVGGDDRVFAWRRIPRTRLVAVVGLNLESAFEAADHHYRIRLAVFLVAALVLALAAAGILFVHLRLERRRLELQASEARFRDLVDASVDWYWESGPDHRFTFLSNQVGENSGIDGPSHLGKTRWDLPALNLGEADWAAHRAQLERHEPFRNFLMRRPDVDGREFWVSINGNPVFGPGGEFVGYRGTGRNVTSEVLYERSLQELNRTLETRVAERTRDLQTALKELEAFSYSVSHDLRAPLRAIAGFAHMAREGENLSDEGARQLGVVEANAMKLGKLVDDLLELARLSRAAPSLDTVDVGRLANEVVAEIEAAYPKAAVAVGELPAARGNEKLLRQALLNLVGNAAKFSASRDPARIDVGWDPAQRAYFVRDNGVGFDMAYANKLFGTFQRLHAETEFPGTGIGLAIVKRAIERQGGRVWAEGVPGEGACFYFALERAR